MTKFDVIIIGAGAAGLSAAATAIKRGRNVAILDMGYKVARKVYASGGGRCNFTNAAISVNRYFGENPKFVHSAINRITPHDILDWATNHNIQYIEKSPGQYFSVDGSEYVVNALVNDSHGAKLIMRTHVSGISHGNNLFHIITSNGEFYSKSVIIATGGVSFPALEVSDIGYKIAKHFGHKIIPVRPALCAIATNVFPTELAGISVNAEITIGHEKINDSLLITHFGIGGPAVYRATVRNLDNIRINMMPNIDVYQILKDAKHTNGRRNVATILSNYLPNRIAKWLCNDARNIADFKDCELKQIVSKITDINIPRDKIKLHGMQSAEVVRGGVDTNMISSKTMESKLQPGLFFAGEVLDIAGDLGGFNLHWAWVSGRVAGENA